MIKINGAKAVVRALKGQGVKHVFGLPGTAIMDIYDTLYGDEDIKLITVRHEQGAAHMADGYARASGNPGVCILSRGPGSSNALMGVVNAHDESSPVLILAGIPGTDIHAYDAFEEMDLVSTFRPVTKRSFQVPNANRTPEFVTMAYKKTLQGRPRPVFLAIPEDFQNRDIQFEELADGGELYRPAPSEKAIDKVIEFLAMAKAPTILAGGGARAAAGEGLLTRLAEKLQVPVVTSWLRDDLMPTQHPLFVGTAGIGAFSATIQAIEEADLILSLGCRFSEFTTNRYRLLRKGQKLVHVDIDPGEIGKIYSTDAGITADVSEFITALLRRLRSAEGKINVGNQWADALRQSYLEQSALPPQPVCAGVHPLEVIDGLNNMQTEEHLYVTDSGNFTMWLSKYMQINYHDSYISPAGGALGFGYPAALGAQLARPDKRVICLTGDGGFIMNMQEMMTAVCYKIPVVTIVFNNQCYANVKVKQQTAYGGRLIGADLKNPDFAAVARECGMYSEKVQNPGDFEKALSRCLNQSGPALIDVELDQENLSPPGVVFFTSKGTNEAS